MFAGIDMNHLDMLEHIYNKPFPDDQYEALHTYAIFLTKKRLHGWTSGVELALIWKPFIGFRWVKVTETIGMAVFHRADEYYTRIAKNFDGEILNLDLQCSVLEKKQKDFDKWQGDELTNKLVEHLSQPEMVELIQQHIREVSEKINNGTYKPTQEKWKPVIIT